MANKINTTVAAMRHRNLMTTIKYLGKMGNRVNMFGKYFRSSNEVINVCTPCDINNLDVFLECHAHYSNEKEKKNSMKISVPLYLNESVKEIERGR